MLLSTRVGCRLRWPVYLLLSTVLTVQAQKKPSTTGPVYPFGQVQASELQADPYPQDTTAEAVVLYDYGNLTIELRDTDFWLVTNYRVRTKIRKKSGYDRATVSKQLQRGSSGKGEHITDVEGYTHNLVDGAVVRTQLDKSGIFIEKASDNVSLYKFTLPNVREGAIIEYKYTLHTPLNVNPNPRTWTFQQHVPVLWSEYNATIPFYFYYKLIMSGYLPLAVKETKEVPSSMFASQPNEVSVQYRFAVKDAPAFRDEAYITTESDYIAKVEFELAKYTLPGQGSRDFSVSWPTLDATLVREPYFGPQFKRAPYLHDVAELINRQTPDSAGRINAAYAYIANTMKWDGTPGLMSNSTRKAFEARKGDVADINLMLIGLLREMDFDANPVILSTRTHGYVDEGYPLIKKFNYVVAHVMLNGKDLLLDATDVCLKPGMLPRQCLNRTGRLVHLTKGRFVSLLPAERDAEVISAAFTLGEDGDLSGTLDYSHGGYRALTERKAFLTNGHAKYVDAVRKKKLAWQIERATVSNVDSMAKPLNIAYRLTIPEACQLAGDRFYLRPMLTEGHTINLFKEPERRYPVDFGAPIDETYVATFTLPKGVVVEEAPKPIIVALPNNGGRFVYQVVLNDRQVTVTSRISIRNPIYYAGDYALLREFYDKILAKHAEQIVMKRSTIADSK